MLSWDCITEQKAGCDFLIGAL